MKVKTAVLSEPYSIEVEEHNLGENIHPDAIMLEVLQSNICGSDLHIYKGNHPVKKSGGLGHEMVGRIVLKGENVKTDRAGTPIEIGDRIVPVYYLTCNTCKHCLSNDHFLCENKTSHRGNVDEYPWFQGSTFATHYYIHPRQYFFKVPDEVSNSAASSANCALSQVIFGIQQLNLKKGEYVLIQGAGGLGINATAKLNELGARVIVADTIDSRLVQAELFGAEFTVNIKDNDISEEINKITNGRGLNNIIEVSGSIRAFNEGISLINKNGTYLIMGILSNETLSTQPGEIVRKSINIKGFHHYSPFALYEALQFLERNKNRFDFDNLISHKFSFVKLEEAIEKSINREVARAGIVFN